jgi:predicted GNAT family acetyltransferase
MKERNPKDISLLLNDNNEVVSMACVTGYSLNSARLGYVYTDKLYRGNQYSRYITANLVNSLLKNKKNKFVCCYADIDYPSSNIVYKSIGFKRKDQITVFNFV